ALLSRCRVFVLKALGEKELLKVIRHALTSPAGFGPQNVQITDRQMRAIAAFANGDARMALNTLEMAVMNGEISEDGILVTDEGLKQCVSKTSLLYDKNGEEHYNLISALHKSMRNSDPDAAIYWMCRMLEGGENPLYIARRLIRFASEDVGMADSRALQVAVAAYQACHFLGMPECDVHLTHAVTYLSMAPKSNALYAACEECKQDVKSLRAEPVPFQLRNAPTKLMKDLEYGKGYEYAHDTEEKLTHMQCMPESLKDREYYRPTKQGDERRVRESLEKIKEWKRR
ncbi:MAG: replication-associated recombination protein A, partial [Dorea sp.]|nr:replication-associated recombination protein A [Dorea sp.]